MPRTLSSNSTDSSSMADISMFAKTDLPAVHLVHHSVEDTAVEDLVEAPTVQEVMVDSEVGMLDAVDMVQADMHVEGMVEDMEGTMVAIPMVGDIVAEDQGEDSMFLLRLTISLIRHRREAIHLRSFLSRMYDKHFWTV